MNFLTPVSLFFISLVVSGTSYAEIYREVSPSGIVTFTDKSTGFSNNKPKANRVFSKTRNRASISLDSLRNVSDSFENSVFDGWLSLYPDCSNHLQRIDLKHKKFLQFFSQNSPLVIPFVNRKGNSFGLYYSTNVRYQIDTQKNVLIVHRTKSKPRVLYRCENNDVPQYYRDRYDAYLINQDFLADQSIGNKIEINDGAEFLLQECRRAFEAKEYKTARSVCKLAAVNEKNIAANYYLGMLYRFNNGGDRDFKQSFQYTIKAANAGFSSAYSWLAWHYNFAKGVPQNTQLALKWYIAAVDSGQLKTAKTVASFYMKGKGVEKDLAQAAVWLTIASKAGDDHAQNKLGCMYANGVGVKQDYKLAHHWILKSHNQYNAKGIFNLAVLYDQGKVVKDGKGYAKKLYKKAKDRGINKTTDIIDKYDRVWLDRL